MSMTGMQMVQAVTPELCAKCNDIMHWGGDEHIDGLTYHGSCIEELEQEQLEARIIADDRRKEIEMIERISHLEHELAAAQIAPKAATNRKEYSKALNLIDLLKKELKKAEKDFIDYLGSTDY